MYKKTCGGHGMQRTRNRQTAVRLAVCLTLTALFCGGCTEDASPGSLMKYASVDAAYTVAFDGNIVGSCERSGGTTVLRVTSPERLEGLTVTYDGTNCSVGVGGMEIPLSAEVAAGLTDVFDLLAREDGVPVKSSDGLQTIVTFADGTVTLNETGVPVQVTVGEREINIGEWNG